MNLFVLYRYVRFLLRGCKPSEVMLDITTACNASCRYCPRVEMSKNRKNKYMSLEVFERAVEELKKNKVRFVRLYSTGEPLLHPDFDHMIHRLKKEGFHITVSTNGLLLCEHLEALKKVDVVQVSISGWDEQSYEFLHHPLPYPQVYYAVRRFYQNIQGLIDRPTVVINTLRTLKTDMTGLRMMWQCFCDELRVSPLTGTTVFRDGVFVSIQESCLKGYYMPSVWGRGRGCSYPFDTVVVSFDGKIGLCCADYCHELPLGYVHEGVRCVFNSYFKRGVRWGFLWGTPDVCRGCSRFLKVKK